MRVLGIDCGTERTGYGVIDSDGRVHRMVAAGCIRSSARDPLELRLLNIAGALRDLIAEYRPDSRRGGRSLLRGKCKERVETFPCTRRGAAADRGSFGRSGGIFAA